MYLQAVKSLKGGEADAFTLNLVPKVMLWGLIEIDLAVIACCLPTLAPVMRDRTFSSVALSAWSLISFRSHDSDQSEGRKRQKEAAENQARHTWLDATTKRVHHNIIGRGSLDGSSAGEPSIIRKDIDFHVSREEE